MPEKKVTPFPLQFAEEMPDALLLGDYADETQTLRFADAMAGTTTSVETNTDGYGDTDTDSDSD